MNKEENISKIIILIVGLLVGISFLGILSSFISEIETTQDGTDALNVSLALIDENNVNTSYVYQLVGGTDLGGPGKFTNFILINDLETTLINSTDYNLDTPSGSLTLKNTTNVLESTTLSATYNYGEDTYSSSTKLLIDLLVGLFSLIILGFIITYLIKVYGGEK